MVESELENKLNHAHHGDEGVYLQSGAEFWPVSASETTFLKPVSSRSNNKKRSVKQNVTGLWIKSMFKIHNLQFL